MRRYIFSIAIVALALISFSACSNDDEGGANGGGTPVVRYVRPCDADISDSLLTGGFLGNQIAIIGEHLSGVNVIYFNDQKAKLNPNFVTDNAIIVTIPQGIPGEKQDLIKLYTSADSCYYTFETKVPAPSVNSMTCEYVIDGDIAYIHGLYFVNDESTPLKVSFSKGLEAEIISQDLNNIAVKVPEGAQPGPVTVTSAYGSGESSFYFRDNRNIILDFNNGNYPDYDYFFGWHGATGVASEGGIAGNYLIMSGNIGGDDAKVADADYCFDVWTYTPQDPDWVNAGALDKQVLKFEVKVTGDWSAASLQFIFTGYADVHMNWQTGDTDANENWKWSSTYPRGLWTPWLATGTFNTDGWITVAIPMADFKYGQGGGSVAVNGAGHYSALNIFMGDGGVKGIDCSPTLWIDNVRVVSAN